MAKALKGVPATRRRSCSRIEPDYADYAAKFPVDLQLSGHSHGGRYEFLAWGRLFTGNGSEVSHRPEPS